MKKPHYIVRRSRSGRFNFTLLTEHGRINGCVVVQVEKHQTHAEIEAIACQKIQVLAENLVRVTGHAPSSS